MSIANHLDGGLNPCEPGLSNTLGGSLKGTRELSASSDEMTEGCRNWRMLWCSLPVGHAKLTRVGDSWPKKGQQIAPK